MTQIRAEALGVQLGGHVALRDVSVAFARGQVTAIVGPNGAGKSTLLACLAGLRAPQTGQVQLDGQPMLRFSPRDRARRIAFLAQTPEVAWSVAVRTLVGLGRTPHIGALGLSRQDDHIVADAMAAADVTALADRDVASLSGGERARVLIARALAGEPEWLLADEPLAGLDPGHQLDAAKLFDHLAHDQGRGVIITLHDLTLAARMADRVLVLADGAVLADGPVATSLSADILAKAYGVQTRHSQGQAGPLIEILGRTHEA